MVKIRKGLGVIGFFMFLVGGLRFIAEILSENPDETAGAMAGFAASVGIILLVVASLLKQLD